MTFPFPCRFPFVHLRGLPYGKVCYTNSSNLNMSTSITDYTLIKTNDRTDQETSYSYYICIIYEMRRKVPCNTIFKSAKIFWIFNYYSAHIRGPFRNFSASPRKPYGRKSILALFVNIVNPNFNKQCPLMFEYCYLSTEEGYILGLQILIYNMDDFVFAHKMVSTKLGFEFRK